MTVAPIPAQEEARLQALHALRLLDTEPEERFDRYSRLAAQIFGTSAAFVSLIDRDEQFFKSRVGLDACRTSRDVSLCSHAILGDEILVVPDTRLDERFADNPLVTGEPFLRFYAGHPLRSGNGQKVGTFCIADRVPHQLSDERREVLRELAALVEKELQMTDAITLQEQLITSQRELLAMQERVAHELQEAARTVEASLPRPIKHPLDVRWLYLPSSSLGGDGFGYFELTPGRFAIYLLDVCGHGVAAALLAVVVLHVLRSRALAGVDFAHPAQVLTALNTAFPMSKHGQRFFTAWYGVVDAATGELTFAGAGHPPAFAIDSVTGKATRLASEGIPVGCLSNAHYTERGHRLSSAETLYLFSDGLLDIGERNDPSDPLLRLEHALIRIAREDSPLESLIPDLHRGAGEDEPLRATATPDDIALVAARLPSRTAGQNVTANSPL